MSFLLLIDKKLFYFFNQVLAFPPFDPVMAFFSSKVLALFAIVGVLTYTALRRRWQLFTVFCFILMAVGIADFTAYNVVKPLFGRIRPCHLAPDLVRTVYGCGGKYSFPSNHAANLATAAFFVCQYFGWRVGKLALGVAMLVGLSRVYLGVHYPLDVAFGFLYGVILGWAVYHFGLWFMQFYFPRSFITSYLQVSAKGK